MGISDKAWRQIRNIRQRDLVKALEKDGWIRDVKSGARMVFLKKSPDGQTKRVPIHYHPNKNFAPGTLKSMIKDTGWTDVDLIDLKLIK